MKKFYSKINPTLLLHQISTLKDIPNGRIDLSKPKEFLQIIALDIGKEKTFYPHKHIWKMGEKEVITQESWIIIKGHIKGVFYDIDDTVLGEEILNPGDCSITFQGGHTIEILEDNTIFYEIKTGPYKGLQNDKIKI